MTLQESNVKKLLKIATLILSIICLSIIAIFMGSALIYHIPAQPIHEISRGGWGMYHGNLNDQSLMLELQKICRMHKCKSFDNSYALSPNESFHIQILTDDNNELTLLKFKDQRVSTSFSQKKIARPTQKFLSILREIEKTGVEINTQGGEKWLCNGQKLNKSNCKRVNLEEENQALIEVLTKEYPL